MTKRFDDFCKVNVSSGMKYLLHGVFSIAIVAAAVAPAQSAQAKQSETPASAGAAATQDDIFVPTSAWLVGPATLAPPDGKRAPCVMANQFNNGFLFRFSGGGQKLYAMAVDFRQKAFTPGQSYAVGLTVGSKFHKTVKADAYDAATLLINLQSQPDLYNQVAVSDTLSLSLGKKQFDFAMLGANEGLRRMESCFDPAGGASDAPVNPTLKTGMQTNVVPRVPPIARDSGDVDPSYQQALSNTALGAGKGDALPDDKASEAAADSLQSDAQSASLGMHTVVPTPAPAQEEIAQADDAGPNGLVDRMLKKAAVGIGNISGAGGNMGGMQTALTPQPPKVAVVNSGRAGVSPSIQGSVEPDARYRAVTDPGAVPQQQAQDVPASTSGGALAKSWTSSAIQPGGERDVIAGAQRSIALNQDGAQAVAQVAPSSGAEDKRWRAMSGSNLHDILTIWAQNEHVKLVWDANKEYSVKESVSQRGNFEGAVQDMLQQYNGDGARPVGQLYRDPGTGQKVLIIKQDQSAQAAQGAAQGGVQSAQ